MKNDKIIKIGKQVFIPQSLYDSTHSDFKGVWTSERYDWPDWETIRDRYVGKRTWMPPCWLFGSTCLLIEGQNFTILPDTEFDEMLVNGAELCQPPTPKFEEW